MPREGRAARQVAAFFIIGFMLVTLVLGAGVHFVSSRAVDGQLDAQVARETAELILVEQRGGFSALQRAIRTRDERGVNAFGYALRDGVGRQVAGELMAPTPRSGVADVYVRDAEGRTHEARALATPLADGGLLVVAIESGPTDALHLPLMVLFGASLIVMLLLGIVGGLLFDRTIRARLGIMNASAQAIIAGDLDSRIAVSGRDDEFDQLAATLNAMLDRIHGLVENLRRVSTDIGHDLRTPITRLRQRLERIRRLSAQNGQDVTEIETAIEEADAILSLFAALMRISEVESGALRRFFTRVDLSRLLERLGESYELAAEDGGRTLTCAIAPSATIDGDSELLAQVFVNLLENALRHTSPGARVRLSLRIEGARAIADVADNGPGIPVEDRANVLQRFARLERARTTPGNGLGLNLVQAVVTAHGGTLNLSDNEPGLIVSVMLPLSG